MKRLLLIFVSLLCVCYGFAQEDEGITTSQCLVPAPNTGFCSYRLCDTCTALPFDSAFVKQDLGLNYGLYRHSASYPGDVTYRKEYTPPDDCINTKVPNPSFCTTDSTGVLHYDVYYPSNYNGYSQCPLPAIIYVHGGGFSDCKTLSKTGNDPDAIAFARRGFVFINIEYRTGVRISRSPQYQYATVQQQLAEYRASQDVRGAIRTIILRQRKHDSLPLAQRTPYQIDTNNIFLGGNSAGAITVLNVAYYTRQAMLDSINPYLGAVSIKDALGPIDADYYVGDTTIEYHSKIKGVLAQWGSLTLPRNFSDSTTAKNFFDQRIPIICFHGLNDPVVPPYVAGVKFAPVDTRTNGFKDSLSTEKSCLITSPFKSEGKPPSPDIFNVYTYGSPAYVNNILKPLGIRYELYLDCDASHGLDNDGPNFKSDYGIGDSTDYSTIRAVSSYITGRAATFFQTIIGGNAQTSHKVFVECRNERVMCNGANKDDGCLNTDICGTHPHQ